MNAAGDQAALASALAALLETLRFPERPAKPLSVPEDSTLARLVTGFSLSAFETRLLLLAAGLELEPELGKLCAKHAADETRRFATFGLALRIFKDAHWDAFGPEAPLRGARLIALGEGPQLMNRALYIEERVLHALMGAEEIDPRLLRRLLPIDVPRRLSASREALAKQASRAIDAGASVHFIADAPAEALPIAARAAANLGKHLYSMPSTDIPADAGERDELLRLWWRETVLGRVALAIQRDDANPALRSLLEHARGAIFVVGREGLSTQHGAARFRLLPEPLADRVPSWREQLSQGPNWAQQIDERTIEDLATQFTVGPDTLSRALAAARAELPEGTAAAGRRVLWGALRREATPRLDDLAHRVDARSKLEQLVLPEEQVRSLRAIIGQVQHKAQVQHRWGFADSSARGAGTTAVFAGPSGTGKTMAAEVLATALELDLFRVDLSAVISKYIGETEENLRRVFDAAEAGGAILLFDEADALFGKRMEVKDSHDRHANVEVSYLLQRMEAYTGLAILTTNMKKSIDEAFFRRIQFVIDFPFPDSDLRERIWRGIFPQRLPTKGLDEKRLAQLSVAGGNIRSIARNAAFLAAQAGGSVTMEHLLEAARLEYAKLGRSLPPGEVRGWI